MPPTTTEPRILADTRGAHIVLTAALAGDLPMPDQVQIMDLHASSKVTFFVRNLDELTAWAVWLDEVIETQPIAGRLHHCVDGEIFDQALRVLTITKAAG